MRSGALAGLIVSGLIFLGLLVYFRLTVPAGSYDMKPGGKRPFAPLLGHYTAITKTIIGLSTGGILLIVQGLKLQDRVPPVKWAFPVLLFVSAIILGLVFQALLVRFYEGYEHDSWSYTRGRYCLVQALGYGSLISFAVAFVSVGVILG